jgi:hypothetical protein
MECLVRLAVASFVCQLVKVNLVQKLLRSESFLTAFSSTYSIKSLVIWIIILVSVIFICQINYFKKSKFQNLAINSKNNDNSDWLFSFFRFKEKNYGSSGATSGLTSSLAFTPVQVSFTYYSAFAEFLLIFNCIASVGIFYFVWKWLWETVNGSIVKYEKQI